jgi:hypothetical protein
MAAKGIRQHQSQLFTAWQIWIQNRTNSAESIRRVAITNAYTNVNKTVIPAAMLRLSTHIASVRQICWGSTRLKTSL